MTKQVLSFLILACAGCAPLTRTQVKAVNQFADAGKNFSDYPAKIMTSLAEVRSRRGVYAANSIQTPALHIEELDSIHSFTNETMALAEDVDLSVKIIDKYAQSLLLLSSDKHVASLDEQSKTFGTGLDSLTSKYNATAHSVHVPAGLGGAVAQLIASGGKQYIRIRQATELKKFVQQADTLVGVMTTNLLQFLLSSNIKELIAIEEKGVRNNYLSYLRQVKTVYSTVSGDSAIIQSNTRPAIANDNDYLQLKTAVENIKKLQQQTVLVTKAMRKAHTKLLETVRQKRTLSSALDEVMALQEEVKKVKLTVSKIERAKTTLP